MHRLLPLLLAALALPAAAQPFAQPFAPPPAADPGDAASNPVAATPAAERLAGFAARRSLAERSLLGNVPFRSVGPTVMSGRVTDVDVSPADPATFYVAYASGGLWRTTSGGAAFEPLFDDQAVMTLGDIAVDWRDPEGDGVTIWAGTGENNSSRSSYAGTGVYKSTDGGASWQHLGLGETQHTGRIVLHPGDPETAWVAAIGPLYSPGPDRGVYKTTDGGATWERTLFVSDDAGVIDLALDPSDPDVLYAAAWERTRRAWDFTEAGAGSGIYKSADGGASWTLLTVEGSGFPTGAGVGRIGLAVYPGNPQTIFASLDNQNRRPAEADEEALALTKDALRTMPRDAFLALAEDELNDYLDRNGFPISYTAASLLEMVEAGDLEPVALVEYLEDANRQLFDTPVVGAEVYRSDDGGQTWTRTHEGYLDDLVFSYGYYFGEVRVAPDNPDRLYLLGVPIIASSDGGATWENIGQAHVHVDHHALFVNPNQAGHLVSGNDGGINVSYDDGTSWFKANVPPVGQFYTVAVDAQEPYHVYGGLQDNGVWAGPHTHTPGPGWLASGDYDFDWIMGGDGMQIAVDTRTNNTVYTGFQFGNYFRLDRPAPGADYERTRITPRHDLGERPLRFNWQTPIHLSRHNQDILYLGSQKLHRSLDRGETWTALSDDLTLGGIPGDVPYGTLTSIDESPLRFGLLVVGSDDGLVHVTEDGGRKWTNVSAGLPADLWVSRVVASAHDERRLYAALSGYRWDHFDAYVYRSDDLGQTWQRIGMDLPAEPVNVVVEDPANEDLLFVGTDHGLYASLDGGASFMTMMGERTGESLPHTPVHDAVIHEGEHHLVLGTHGRSIWVADLEHVAQLTPEVLAGGLRLFEVEPVQHSERWGEQGWTWGEPTTPEAVLTYFAPAAGQATVTVTDSLGTLITATFDSAEAGLNTITYDLTVDPDEVRDDQVSAEDGRVYLGPGDYTVSVALDGETAAERLTVEPAPAPPSRGRKKTP
ncbi:MAG: glycosyl hydrolase [Bacteroidota bacterium]